MMSKSEKCTEYLIRNFFFQKIFFNRIEKNILVIFILAKKVFSSSKLKNDFQRRSNKNSRDNPIKELYLLRE